VRITRFAPSPSGDLHLGGALVALASRLLGDRCLLRVEDLDPPRVVPGAAARIEDDLRWLGLWFDAAEPTVPMQQSARGELYQGAVDELTRKGLTYPCDCSRSEIARIASAPHAGEDRVYPGTCRDRAPSRKMARAPTLRLRVPLDAHIGVVDHAGGGGVLNQYIHRDVGDFVLRRADGVFSYQLAVAYDDATMGITHVVRGRDLLASTPRQLLLMRLLDLREPIAYVHVPLVLDVAGERLAKRTQGARVPALREAGVPAQAILDELLGALGWQPLLAQAPTPLVKLQAQMCAERIESIPWPRTSWRIPPHFAALGSGLG
jgi:glutamyl-tRNA synthetase